MIKKTVTILILYVSSVVALASDLSTMETVKKIDSRLSNSDPSKFEKKDTSSRPTLKEIKSKYEQKKLDSMSKDSVVLGPKVGGGGFSYYYTSIPNLLKISNLVIEIVGNTNIKQIIQIFGTTENAKKFIAELDRISVDIASGLDEQRMYYVEQQTIYLTSQLLEQLNITEPDIRSINFVTEQIFAALNEIQHIGLSIDQVKLLSNIVSFKFKSCGFSGDIPTRINNCIDNKNGNIKIISRDFQIDKNLKPKPVTEIVFDQNSKLIWLKSSGFYKSGQIDKVEDFCRSQKKLKFQLESWRLPTKEDVQGIDQTVRKAVLFPAFAVDTPFFAANGNIFLADFSEHDPRDSKRILIGFTIFGTMINPFAALLQFGAGNNQGFYDEFKKKYVSPVCVAKVLENQNSLRESNDISFNLDGIRAANIPSKQTSEKPNSDSLKMIEKVLTQFKARAKATISRIVLDSSLNSEIKQKWPNFKLARASEILDYIDSIALRPDALLSSVYRENPDSGMEPLIMDYLLPDQLDVQDREKFPKGIAFPVRGLLLKLAGITDGELESNTEFEIYGTAIHELSHLMGVGIQDDREAKEFAEFIRGKALNYWEDCGDLKLSSKKSADLCAHANKKKGWDLIYRKSRNWMDGSHQAGEFGVQEIVKSKKTNKAYAYVGYDNFEQHNVARAACESEGYRLITALEAEELFAGGSSPREIFNLRETSKSDPHCIYLAENAVRCDDGPRPSNLAVYFVIRLAKAKISSVICAVDPK